MGWWNEQVVPRMADRSCGAAAFDDLRAEVCRGLEGRVLEIGAGSGHNLPHLPTEVHALMAVEPSDVAWRRVESRFRDAAAPVTRIGLDGQQIDLPDDSVDAVLATFVLCTIPDVRQALDEVHRVLKPGGRLHFLEHGLAPERRTVTWQQRWEPLQRRVAGGCHLTRDPAKLAVDAGFTIERLTQGYLPGAPKIAGPWTYLHRGVATS